MNLSGLRDSFRARAGDTKKPYLWSDLEVDAYINEAYTEAVDRGLVIYDRESFTVDVEVGITDYQLPPAIIRVIGAAVTSRSGVDLPESEPEPMRLSNRRYDFTSREFVDGAAYRIDEDGMFVLASSPTEAAVIALEVHRYPDMLEGDDDEPVVMAIYHQKMLSWALKLAYLKPDADTFDLGLSDKHDEEFTRTFGPPKTAQDHRQRRRRQARSYKTPGY
jgi:hypothetical protein